MDFLEKDPENFRLLEALGKYTTYCRMDKIKSAVGKSGCVGFISILLNYIIVSAILLPFLCFSTSVLPPVLFFSLAFCMFVGSHFVKKGMESIPLFNEQLGELEKCLERDLISLINQCKTRETNEVAANEKTKFCRFNNSMGEFQVNEEPTVITTTQPARLYPPLAFFNGTVSPEREAINNNMENSLYDRDRMYYK
ncbi:hypothetical protein [Rickettsiella endosymbiont of Dermanyssus gallinae]|uniref:hypothetical protein n=1 Tax=Rickettsiella endosymbiont of Dermanyssus gallinae TaxID=2856608 RepID=UPI001C532AB1|nr:hypothetical protein [Rickettsiella endosymbiont of Dermanyssus gallinae]